MRCMSVGCLLLYRKMYRFKCIGLFRDWSIARLSEMHMRLNMIVLNRISYILLLHLKSLMDYIPADSSMEAADMKKQQYRDLLQV